MPFRNQGRKEKSADGACPCSVGGIQRNVVEDVSWNGYQRHEMRPILPVLLPLALLFCSCSSGPKVDPQITAAVTKAGVNGVTAAKINNAQSLDYPDIRNLVSARVPSHIIVGYLRSTQKPYDFSQAQLASLKAAGAHAHLLTYLTETEGFYGPPPAKQGKVPGWIRSHSKLEQDQQPFFYNAPLIDDWYDSAYTESCYSPFSFDTGGGG